MQWFSKWQIRSKDHKISWRAAVWPFLNDKPFCIIKSESVCYLFIHRRLSTQDKITKQWQNDDETVQSKVPNKVKNMQNIKSHYRQFMSSSWGPARVTSLKWKRCHTSLILEGDWQIRVRKYVFCKVLNGHFSVFKFD